MRPLPSDPYPPPRVLSRKRLGRFFSEGSRQLWLLLLREKQSPGWLNRCLGFQRPQTTRYLYGDMRPLLQAAYRIYDVFGIDPRLFITPPRARFVPPAARAAKKRAAEAARKRATRTARRTHAKAA